MAESGQSMVGHAVGAWCWHARHAAPCRVVDRQDMWGETAYRVWLPTKDAVVRARSQDLAQLDSIEPTGAIYVSARVYPFGKKAANGTEIKTNEDVRTFLLEEAALGVVPFQAFGVPGETGWMRLSVGSVSEAQIESGLTRLGTALNALV